MVTVTMSQIQCGGGEAMTRNQWAAVGAIIGVLFVTLACESTTITPGAPTPTPGAYPPSVVDAAHQATVEAVQVERYLNAIEAEDTLRQYHAQATATAEAHALAIWEATATAEAHRVAVTAEIQRHGHGQRRAGSGAPGCGHRHGHRPAESGRTGSGGLARHGHRRRYAIPTNGYR